MAKILMRVNAHGTTVVAEIKKGGRVICPGRSRKFSLHEPGDRKVQHPQYVKSWENAQPATNVKIVNRYVAVTVGFSQQSPSNQKPAQDEEGQYSPSLRCMRHP